MSKDRGTTMKHLLHRGSRRRLLAVAGVIVGASASLSSPAQANTYSVWSCKGPDGRVAPTDGWTSSYAASFSPPTNTCPSGGALSAQLTDGRTQPQDAKVQWIYTPPADTKLRRVDMLRALHSGGVRPYQAPGAFIGVPDADLTHNVDSCFQSFGCGDKSGAFSVDVNDPAGIHFVAACGGSEACQSFGTSGTMAGVSVSLFRARLADDTSPDVQSVGGTLLASGPQRGVKTVSVRATDVGSGVYRALIEIKKPGESAFSVAKAIAIDTNSGRCAPIAGATSAYEFGYGQPCKLSASGDLDFDTTTLQDGNYEMRVSVEDASGNRVTAAAPQTLAVHNAPDSTSPPHVNVPGRIKAGDILTCDPGSFEPAPDKVEFAWLVAGAVVDGATGSAYTVRAADVGKSIVCRVKATRNGQTTTVDSPPVGGPNQPGGPATNTGATSSNVNGGSKSSTTNVYLNPANANGHGGLVQTARFSAASKRTKRIRYGQKATIQGQLKDAAGKPIAGAVVDVYSRAARPGTYLRKVGSVRTNADGIYRYVAPKGVSRALRFGYRAILSSGEYNAKLDVALKVRGKIKLRAKPTAVRSYGVIKLVGKVLGGRSLPRTGVLVEIQVRNGTKWQTVTVKRTKKRGRFRFKHKLTATRRGSFVFRARMRNQSGVPLTATHTKRVKVRVG